MAESVNVKSLDALQEFRSALIQFIDKAKRATSTAESEVYSVQAFVSKTQFMYWRSKIRKSEEKLSQAKSELYRASISQPDNPRGPTDQIKLVKKRQEEIKYAHQQLARTQHWTRIIEHQNHEYRSAMTPLTASLDGDLQKTVVKIDNAIASIELYLADKVQVSKEPDPSKGVASIARKGSDRKEVDHEHDDSQGATDEGN